MSDLIDALILGDYQFRFTFRRRGSSNGRWLEEEMDLVIGGEEVLVPYVFPLFGGVECGLPVRTIQLEVRDEMDGK
jgi:hypothetical protein